MDIAGIPQPYGWHETLERVSIIAISSLKVRPAQMLSTCMSVQALKPLQAVFTDIYLAIYHYHKLFSKKAKINLLMNHCCIV